VHLNYSPERSLRWPGDELVGDELAGDELAGDELPGRGAQKGAMSPDEAGSPKTTSNMSIGRQSWNDKGKKQIKFSESQASSIDS
jgi:hypothetical protein